jgi:hypothetical protein
MQPLTSDDIARLIDLGVVTHADFRPSFVDPVHLRKTGHHEKLSCVVLGHVVEWGYTPPPLYTPVPTLFEKMHDRAGYEARIRAVREEAGDAGLSPAETLDRIGNGVWGFDLNPLAVQTA